MSSSSVGAPGAVVAKPPRRRAGFREGGWQALPFVLPALFLVTFGLVVPVIWTVLLSVNRTRGLNFGDEWLGLDNYERLLTRPPLPQQDEFPWSARSSTTSGG